MLSKEIIINSIEEDEVFKKLFSEILDEQEALKKAYLDRDNEKVLIKTGKFVEALFCILKYIISNEETSEPDFNDIEEKLRNVQKSDLPVSIRIILPRIGKSMYKIRTERGGAHRSDIDPLKIDANYCYNSAKYIIAELVRLYSSFNENIILDYLNQSITTDLPVVEEFEDGRILILEETNSCKEDVILTLYHFYPSRLNNEEIKYYLNRFYSNQNITTSLLSVIKNKLVDRNDEGSLLTRKGIKYVEDEYIFKKDVIKEQEVK